MSPPLPVSGGVVQMFINPDKNMATVRKEILCKKMADYITTLLDAGTAFARRSTGSVCVDRQVLFSIVIINEHSARLAWNDLLAVKLKLEQSAVNEQFAVVAGLGLSP